MTLRKTGCLLYPGPTRSEWWRVGAGGALVTIGTDRSLCGREADAGEIPEADWPDLDTTARPAGLCPRCWAKWKRDTVNNDKETEHMNATCYLCSLHVPRAKGQPPNVHPECGAEAERLDLRSHLHDEDLPGALGCLDTLEAEGGVSPEYRAFRATLAQMEDAK